MPQALIHFIDRSSKSSFAELPNQKKQEFLRENDCEAFRRACDRQDVATLKFFFEAASYETTRAMIGAGKNDCVKQAIQAGNANMLRSIFIAAACQQINLMPLFETGFLSAVSLENSDMLQLLLGETLFEDSPEDVVKIIGEQELELQNIKQLLLKKHGWYALDAAIGNDNHRLVRTLFSFVDKNLKRIILAENGFSLFKEAVTQAIEREHCIVLNTLFEQAKGLFFARQRIPLIQAMLCTGHFYAIRYTAKKHPFILKKLLDKTDDATKREIVKKALSPDPCTGMIDECLKKVAVKILAQTRIVSGRAECDALLQSISSRGKNHRRLLRKLTAEIQSEVSRVQRPSFFSRLCCAAPINPEPELAIGAPRNYL